MMKVLFDHCIPKPLRRHLAGHNVRTAYEMGWADLKNGMLLKAAESEFDALLTVDQNMSSQQNMRIHGIALIVMVARDNTVGSLLPLIPELMELLPTVEPGRVYRI